MSFTGLHLTRATQSEGLFMASMQSEGNSNGIHVGFIVHSEAVLCTCMLLARAKLSDDHALAACSASVTHWQADVM